VIARRAEGKGGLRMADKTEFTLGFGWGGLSFPPNICSKEYMECL
jgi:hypothetical protein